MIGDILDLMKRGVNHNNNHGKHRLTMSLSWSQVLYTYDFHGLVYEIKTIDYLQFTEEETETQRC